MPQQGNTFVFPSGILHCDPNGHGVWEPLGQRFAPPAQVSEQAAPAQELQAWYQSHGGEALFGRALTPPVYNERRGWWEQYFENFAVYWDGMQNLPPSLLPLGYLACGPACWQGQQPWHALPQSVQTLPPEILILFSHIGGYPITGPLLEPPFSHPHTGALVVIFRNLAIGYQPGQPASARVLPIVTEANLHPADAPVPPENAPGLVFIMVDPQHNLGYNLPLHFDRFLMQHGGRTVLCGDPITERHYRERSDLIEQWCTNIGLRYNLTTHEISLAPIGDAYRTWMREQIAQTPILITEPRIFPYLPATVQVGKPFQGQVQVFHNDAPWPGVKVRLEFPDIRYYQDSITNAQGIAVFSLEFQDPNLMGSNLRYRACLLDAQTQALLGCSPEQTVLVWR